MVVTRRLLTGQGIRRIQNLEGYTGLRVLWLEGNGLGRLEGMEAQTEMRTLYAHENLIEKIEGLESCLEASIASCIILAVRHLRLHVLYVLLLHNMNHDPSTCGYSSVMVQLS